MPSLLVYVTPVWILFFQLRIPRDDGLRIHHLGSSDLSRGLRKEAVELRNSESRILVLVATAVAAARCCCLLAKRGSPPHYPNICVTS